MSMKKYIVGAFAFAFVSVVGAATQGVAGPTSTGTFTNTFGDPSRVIQVLGLQDMQFTSQAGVVQHGYGASEGVTDRFCVIDSAKGTVRLTVRGTEKAGRNVWDAAAVDGSGAKLSYTISLQQFGDPNWYWDVLDTFGIELSGNELVEDASGCANGGNVGKAIALSSMAPVSGTKVFKDTVTVTVTPQ
jgi:hypothetical protein